MPELIQSVFDEEDVLYTKNNKNMISGINYHCLDSLSIQEAKCLIQFKNWIRSQPQILNPVLDASFLLRFLRVRNFNVREAAEVFIKYLKVRELHPHCYKSLDVRDPGVLDLMSRGYMFPLYERDKQGRMVIFCKGSTFNQKHGHKPTDLFRSIIMTFETLLDDQDNQSNGFTYIFDQSGVCLSEVTFLGVFELQKLARSGEKALPVKHKAVHWLNLPPLIMTCFYFISSFLTEKLRKRLFIHKNLSSLQESIPVDILPKEYGGRIPWKEMSDSWIDTLTQNRSKLLKLDQMKWDESKAPSKIHLILPPHSGTNNN